MLRDIQNLRGARQFGYALTDEENISQGIGIREGVAYGEKPAFVPPDTVYQEDRVEPVSYTHLDVYKRQI